MLGALLLACHGPRSILTVMGPGGCAKSDCQDLDFSDWFKPLNRTLYCRLFFTVFALVGRMTCRAVTVILRHKVPSSVVVGVHLFQVQCNQVYVSCDR